MVYLVTGPRGSGKTQQMIDLANEKVKTSNGNVVFIKKSHKDTYTVDFNIRVIRMADYPDVLTLEEFVGFLYGMAAGNHDIEAVFIDSVLKQANITLESLAAFLHKLNKISTENNIDFYLSISADKKDIPGIDSSDCTVVSLLLHLYFIDSHLYSKSVHSAIDCEPFFNSFIVLFSLR